MGYSIRRYISKQSLLYLLRFRIFVRKGEIIEWKGYLLLLRFKFLYIHNIYAHNIFRNAKAISSISDGAERERERDMSEPELCGMMVIRFLDHTKVMDAVIGRPIHHRPQNFFVLFFLLFVRERERERERGPRPVYIYKVRCARPAVIFTTDNFSLFIHECGYTHPGFFSYLYISYIIMHIDTHKRRIGILSTIYIPESTGE